MCSEIGLVLKKIYQKVLTYTKKSDKVSVRRKHLDWQGGKWKSIASRKNSLSAGSEAGRYLVNRKPASLTGTQGTKRGDAR